MRWSRSSKSSALFTKSIPLVFTTSRATANMPTGTDTAANEAAADEAAAADAG